MKIIGGQFKGKNFYMPQGIRPTQSVTREAVFDIIGHDLSGLAVLDLFAGSGAVGLEAVSRGARKTVLVEKDPKCAQVIGENFRLLPPQTDFQEGPRYEILEADAFATVKLFARQGQKFDLIFVDPPYGRGLAKKALKTLGAYDILQPNCVVFIQHVTSEILPEHQGRIVLFRRKQYGSTYLSIYQS